MDTTSIDEIGRTALMTAALRARESARPDRLVDDDGARAVAAASGVVLPDAAAPFVALMGEQIAVRTRVLDDALLAADLRQVVLLAAGMDSRARRLPWPAGTRVFEVDRAPVLAAKEPVLGAPRCDLRAVAADLAGPWTDALESHGFDPARPTAWLAEGLLYALDEPAADALLAAVTAVSAPGSVVVLDHVRAGVELHEALRALDPGLDALWRGGPADPDAWLRRHGWLPDLHDLADAAARHGRTIPPGVTGWLGTATR